MTVLGIKFPGHDTAVAVVSNGRLVAAVEQERFDRRKHSNAFPEEAAQYCLQEVGSSREDIGTVAYYCDPELQIRHICETGLHREYPATEAAVLAEFAGYAKRRAGLTQIQEWFPSAKVICVPHHRAHATSAYLMSGYSSAAVMTVDGRGEHTTCEYFVGTDGQLSQVGAVKYPNSLGFVYGAISEYLGLSTRYPHYGATGMSFDGEGKLMALAAYGKPSFSKFFRDALRYCGEGQVCVDTSLFSFFRDFTYGVEPQLINALGSPRQPGDSIEQRHMDIACSLQAVVEDCVLQMASFLRERTCQENLCLAGGVFLNSCLNGALSRSGLFDRIFIQPAAGDAGTAAGAALAVYRDNCGEVASTQESALLGPCFELSTTEAKQIARTHCLEHSWTASPSSLASDMLQHGKVIAWFQGRMEFGPRALGNRSILADPRVAEHRRIVSECIKGREWYRPLAMSILEEHCHRFCESHHPSPHMLIVCRVRDSVRNRIPAVVHVDGTSRVQTVTSETNPQFYDLLKSFYDRTGVPVLLNTSLNSRGMPLCCTPRDAVELFCRSSLSALMIGQHVFTRQEGGGLCT